MMQQSVRTLLEVVEAQPAMDGDGVKIQRIAGSGMYAQLDPFLLLDEIRSEHGVDYIGGFPPHPHRGFETITYMLEGAMRHRDHLGNEGLLGPGDVQWMTAGRGVIHSEMPEQSDGLLHGFQLWLNLPGEEKMQPARYQDYRHEQFPLLSSTGEGSAKLIAGTLSTEAGTVRSPVNTGVTEPIYLDITLPAGGRWQQQLPMGHRVMLYVYQGESMHRGEVQLLAQQMGFYSDEGQFVVEAGEKGLRALLLAAKPLGEPMKQYGPFVMNTTEEIQQAIKDYNSGQFVAMDETA